MEFQVYTNTNHTDTILGKASTDMETVTQEARESCLFHIQVLQLHNPQDMHLVKKVCPTYPPDIALLTLDSNIFGLSLSTAAAS